MRTRSSEPYSDREAEPDAHSSGSGAEWHRERQRCNHLLHTPHVDSSSPWLRWAHQQRTGIKHQSHVVPQLPAVLMRSCLASNSLTFVEGGSVATPGGVEAPERVRLSPSVKSGGIALHMFL